MLVAATYLGSRHISPHDLGDAQTRTYTPKLCGKDQTKMTKRERPNENATPRSSRHLNMRNTNANDGDSPMSIVGEIGKQQCTAIVYADMARAAIRS